MERESNVKEALRVLEGLNAKLVRSYFGPESNAEKGIKTIGKFLNKVANERGLLKINFADEEASPDEYLRLRQNILGILNNDQFSDITLRCKGNL